MELARVPVVTVVELAGVPIPAASLKKLRSFGVQEVWRLPLRLVGAGLSGLGGVHAAFRVDQQFGQMVGDFITFRQLHLVCIDRAADGFEVQ